MSERYACDIEECHSDYAHIGSLRTHQRKHHAKSYKEQGLKMKRLPGTAKRQKTTASPPPVIIEEQLRESTIDVVEEQARLIDSLHNRIETLESRFISLGAISANAAREAVEHTVDARISEMYAHILDLKEQLVLIAKKTTKWCVVCFSKENNFAFMPCRHKCVCKECAKTIYDRYKKCPICRQAVTSAKAIYDLSAMDNQ